MGTVATFDRSGRFFDRDAGPVAPLLRAGRACRLGQSQHHHQCRGRLAARIHLPLRLPRLCGSRAAAGDRLGRPVRADGFRQSAAFPAAPGFSACIVLTTPPMPLIRARRSTRRSACRSMSATSTRAHLHLGEVGARRIGSSSPAAFTAGPRWSPAPATRSRDAKAAAYANAAPGLMRPICATGSTSATRSSPASLTHAVGLGMAELPCRPSAIASQIVR